MANGNYKVSLGVDLRVSEIREKINQFNANSNNAKLRLGVKLDTRGLAEQIRAINYKTPVKLAVKFDTKTVHSQINNIKQQLQQLGNIKINLGGAGLGGSGRQDIQTVRIARSIDDATRAYRELLSLQNRIGSKQQAVAKLDTSKNQQEILELSNQVDKLYARYQRLHTLFNGQFTNVQTDRLNRGFEITAEKLAVIKSKADDARASLDRMSASGAKSGTGASGAASGATRMANDLTLAYNKLKNISKNIGSIKISLSSGLNTSKDVQQIEVLEAQLKSLTAQYHKTVEKIKGKGDLSSTQWQKVQHQIDNTRLKLEQLYAKLADAKMQRINNIKLGVESGAFAKDISNIETKFNGLSTKSEMLKAQIDALKLAMKDMQTASNSGNVDAMSSAYVRYQAILKSVENQLRINKNIEQQQNDAEALKQSRNAFLLQTNKWLKDNSAAASEFGSRIKELQAQVNNCDKTSLARLKAEFSNIKREAALAGKTTKAFGDRLKEQFKRYSAYFSVASVIMYSVRALRSMFEQVKAIDSAMIELKKVTNETSKSYNEFLTNAAKRSKELGTTIDGLITSAAGFARLGYGFKESQKLAEVANIYAVVGDEVESVEDATKSLISTMAAFKEQQDNISNEDFAMDIVDKFNEIGNNFAISSGGIGEALTRSASSLAAANNTLDESIALITAANTVVQNPDTVGTAFKTISMRIRGAKTELEEAGLETDGMVESTAKLRSEILAISGVDIMENANEFKSTYKIMDELADKWESLSDIQQATITELIAGKRQGNIVSSLMKNFDTAREALETSMNSEGSAMQEHEKWMQSLEAGINRVKAAWQSLSQSFLKSDFLKGLLKSVESLASGFGKLFDKLGTLPTLLTLFAGGRSLFAGKGFFNFDKETQSIQLLGNSFSALGDKYANVSGKIVKYNSLNAQHQTQFCNSMQNSNTAFGKYIAGLNGSKASMGGYITSLIGAKVATIALKAATMALNMALTMGISLLVSGLFSAIQKLINKEEELAEKVEEVTNKFKEQSEELQKLKGNYNTSNEDSMISRYEKLSKGVDNLGHNVSLTADEYSEYQNIVNQIADQIPSLVSGYDSQGNAILSVKGNVEELTKAYENLIHANNREVLSNVGNITKNWENAQKQASGYDFFEHIGNRFSLDGLFGGQLDVWDMKTDTAEWLNSLNSNMSKEDIKEQLIGSSNINRMYEVIQALQSAGYDVSAYSSAGKISDTLKKALAEEPEKIKGIVNDYYAQFAEIVEQQKTAASAVLSEAFDVSSAISGLDYSNISENLQEVAYQTVNNLSQKKIDSIIEDGGTVEGWTKEMLEQLNSISDEDNAEIESAFNLQTRFNNNEISYGEYIDGLNDVQTTIDGLKLKARAKYQLEVALGLDDDGVVDQYNALVNRLTDTSWTKTYYLDKFGNETPFEMNAARDENGDYIISRTERILKEDVERQFDITEDEAKNLLDGLSAEEYEVAIDVITNLSDNNTKETAEQVQKAIEKEITSRGLSLDLKIDDVKADLDALATAMSESLSGSGLSSESLTAIEDIFGNVNGYDPSKLFERTANGITLNTTELRKLNAEARKTNIDKIDKEMDSLGDAYNQTKEELYSLTYGTKEYNAKAAELSAIEDRIKATEQLAAQYEGLASAYQSWQMAESSGSQRDMYEGIIGGFETMDDEISRGWLDDGTIELLRLIKGENISVTATTKELVSAYESLDDTIKYIGKDGKVLEDTGYSIRDFFTVDEDGNSTNAGVYNFLDAIGRLEEEAFGGKDVVKRDKNGNIISFDFQVAGGDKAIADALGISEELVQIMVRAADDAGFVISMDGTYQQLDVLKEKAQEAADKLKDTFGKTNHVFDLNTGNEGTVLNDYNEALKIWEDFKKNKNEDGTVNMNVKGAEEAYTLVSTLQSMVDKLGEPVYMELDASQVEKDMQTPLSKMQQYERLVQQENQLRLKGTDTKEINKAQKEILDYFENLNPEIKARLGIDDLSREELKTKLESGEIEIPATIDLQVEMNNTLRDMVNIALYNAGIISDKELEKRIDISLYANEVDTSDIEEKVEEKTDDSFWGNLVGNGNKKEVEVDIDIVSKYANDRELQEIIKNYTPLQQKVVLEYFAEHEEVDDYTPEQKEALVKFIVDSMQPDTYAPDDKDATVTYNRDSSEVDNYDPKNFVRTVTYKIKEVVSKIASGGKKKANQRTGADPAGNDSDVNGTAHVNGTAGRAFKQGSWGTKNSGTALGGELGSEILVRNGKWFTIGDNGAEFFQYKKGDIIFNHRQTEELLTNGRVTSGDGRAKALVGGTAFAGGSSGWGGIGKVIGDIAKDAKEKIKDVAKKVVNNTKKSSNNASNNSSNSSSKGSEGSEGGVGKADGNAVGKEADKFEETIDFIEIAISRIEREIDNVDRTANSVYNSWTVRNSALALEINKVTEEIDLQNKAAQRYLREANSVGLEQKWVDRIKNGTINIYDENDFDEETAEKIKEYQKWYELYLNCIDAAAELKETEKELYQQRFDHILEEYDGILQSFEHTETMLNEYISQAEARGHIVSKQYYQALINNEKANISKLKEEQSKLIKARNEAEANGINKNSQAWRDMCAEIDGVTQAIESGTTAIIEYGNAMRDIDWQVFDLMQERISDVATEANFLIELMSFKDMFDDSGKLTSQGLATIGLHGQNVNTYMYQADEYGSEIAKIDSQIASGELDANDQNVINRRRELVVAQRDSILAAESEKKAIRDLVEEGINLELDALQELIDKKNEALESERDLYEYQKKVKEQTEEIASLEKQMAAYSGDDSEEARQKIQQIKVELESARENLQETEWDKYIQDTEKILTDLYDEYQLTLNTRLDDIDALFNQIITDINSVAGEGGVIDTALGSEGAIAIALGSNAATIKTTLETEADNVGIKLSSAMNSIWNTGEGNAKSVLTMYGEDFKSKSSTINTTLNNIKVGIDNMVKALGNDAGNNVTSENAMPAIQKGSNNTEKKFSEVSLESGDSSSGKNNITNETLMGVAAAIWVYGQKSGWGNNPFREDKLSKKLGDSNARKVQQYVNWYGENGALYDFYIKHNRNLDKYKYSAFKLGAKNIDETQLAWTQEGRKQEFIVRPSDGAILTPIAKGDSVLTSVASGNIWNMANNPAEFIKDNLKLDAANVPNASGVNNVYTQHIGQVVFDMENVKNYDEFISAMKRDKNFENLILSMSIDRIAGKSSLAKGKSIR